MSPRETPVDGASNAPIKADLSTIPLPPEGAEGETQAAPAAAAGAGEEAAVLEFLDPGAMSAAEPVRFPFKHPLSGEVVREVSIRRLTFAEALRISEAARKAGRVVTNMDYFAAMTGLPAAVIRGMEAGDADRVTDACLPFLPRSEEAESS